MKIREIVTSLKFVTTEWVGAFRCAHQSRQATTCQPLEVRQLESRILYSASPVPADLGGDSPAENDALAILSPDEETGTSLASSGQEQDQTVESNTEQWTSRELVLVDTDTEDYQQLVDDLLSQDDSRRTFEVVLLDSKTDGFEQVSQILADRHDINAIHLVSHGREGSVKLGSSWLSSDSIAGHVGDLVNWGDALAEDADLLIYGCDLANSAEGRTLIDLLGAVCNCDVAASDDDTGATQLGGDWDFEYRVGSITTDVAFSDALRDQWQHTLDITSNLVAHYEFDEGSGTTAGDSTVNNNDGTLLDSPAWATGVVGDGALNFNGDFDRVDVLDNVQLDFGTSDFSVSFWIDTSQIPVGSARVIGQSSGADGFLFYTDNFGDINFQVNGTLNSTTTWGSGALDGDWHHIAGTRFGNFFQLYIDGVQVDSENQNVGSVSSTEIMRLGSSTPTTSDFDGLIDDVRIYHRELSASDIGELIALATPSVTVDTTSDVADGNTSSIAALQANKGADGFISLREAILATNNTTNISASAPDIIRFEMNSGLIGGAHTINLSSALPDITDAVVIDGTTDSRFSSTPIVVLDGNNASGNGLTLTNSADGSTIRGLVIRDFNGHGINIVSGSDNHTIVGNYIGRLDVNGTDAGAGEGNSSEGIYVQGNGITIGGSAVRDRNVLSGNGSDGIWVYSADNITIQGNLIGVEADGNTALGNSASGVWVTGGLSSVTDVLIGGTGNGEGNIIAHNGADGVTVKRVIASITGVRVLGNSIYSNSQIGIDLGDNNLTTNDVGDADTGPNDLQNFPVITSATTTGSDITIAGTLNSETNSYYRLEFFANTVADGTGHGEAQRYLGFTNVATDGSGNGSYSTNLTVAVGAGEFISATATKSNATYSTFTNTSELAQNSIAVTSNGPPDINVPTAQSVLEEATLTFNSSGSNLISISNDAGEITTVELTVSQGRLTLSQTTGLSFTSGNGTNDATMSFSGTIENVNLALDGLQYTPNQDFTGSDSLTINGSESAVISFDTDGNLVGYYEFTSSDALADSSPVGTNTLTFQGSATTAYDATLGGDVLSLGGGSDYVQISGEFGQPASITLAAWVNGNSGYSEVFSIDNQVMLRFDDVNGSAGVNAIYHDGTTYRSTPSGQFLAGSGWHHLAMTFDDTTKTLTVFIDGVQAGQNTFTNSISYSGGDTYLGSNRGLSLFFNGLIDEARVFDRALSGTEIASLAGAAVYVSDSDAVTINVDPDNDAPTFTTGGLLDATPNFVEGGSAVVLDPDVTIFDVELSGADDFSGASLTLHRNGGADATDQFSATGTLNALTEGGSLVVSGTTVGTVTTNSSGSLVLTFNSNATGVLVDSVLQQITYSNSASYLSGTAQIDWTFDDGNSGAQGVGGALQAAGSINVTLTDSNTLYVDTVTDVDDGDTSSIANLLSNRGTDGYISLREAMLAANNTLNAGGPDAIYFDIAGGGVHTLAPTTALPTITEAVIIDGLTQTGASAGTLVTGTQHSLLIELSGSSVTGTVEAGLDIRADDTIIRGLIVNAWHAQTTTDGIQVLGADNVTIEDNYVGVNATGSAVATNQQAGVNLESTTNSFVQNNLISGSTTSGVVMRVAANNNIVQGNLIGTDATGTIALGNQNGVEISVGSNNNRIGGNTALARNIISGNTFDGVVLSDAGTDFNSILGNHIGLNLNGTSAISNGSAGVRIAGTASNNVIGGTVAADRNVISGNNRGVRIQDDSTSNNRIEGNYIGTNASGTAQVANQIGVVVDASADSNTVGGSLAGAGNLISGNSLKGVEVGDAGTTSTAIQGNLIGLDATGNASLANGGRGVHVLAGAVNTTIGGATATQRNVIAGNTGDGIDVFGASTNTTIQGNYIGTNTAGTAPVGNGAFAIRQDSAGLSLQIGGTGVGEGNVIASEGLYLEGAASYVEGNIIGLSADGLTTFTNGANGIHLTSGGHQIGGNSATARNVISGYSVGVLLDGAASTNNTVSGNYLGTDITGSAGSGNSSYGVRIQASSANNTIGGTVAGAGNTIAYNGTSGVRISSSSVGNSLLGNVVHSNAGLGIDLRGVVGVDANDLGDGDAAGNNLQNFPVLEFANSDGASSINLIGSLNSTATTTYRVEFFASLTGDASGHGEAERFLGATTVTTDALGYATFNTTLGAVVADGEFISATATVDFGGSYGDTSEFAANIVASTINDAPNVTAPASALAATENVNLAIHGTGFTVSDIDEANLGAAAILSVGEGTLTLVAGDSGVSIDSGNGSSLVNLSGSIAQLNALFSGTSTGTIQYLNAGPAPSSSTVLTLTVNDLGNVGTDPGLTGNGSSEEGTASQSILISSTNNPPTITSNGGGDTASVNIDEGVSLVTTVVASDPDVPADTLTYAVAGGSDAAQFILLPSSGQLSFASTPNFEIPTDVNLDGLYEVIVQVSDGQGGVDLQTISVTVADINDAPVALPDSDYTLDAQTVLVVDPLGVLANDSDEDHVSLVANLIIDAQHGSLTLNADGSFEYIPDEGFSGTDQFQYAASDGLAMSSPVVVTITVDPVAAPIPTPPEDPDEPNEPEPTEDPDPEEPPTETESIVQVTAAPTTSTPSLSENQEPSGVFIISTDNLSDQGSQDKPEREANELLFVGRSVDSAGRPNGGRLVSSMSRAVNFKSFDAIADTALTLAFDRHNNQGGEHEWINELKKRQLVVGTTAAVTSSLSVGYVVWLLRGGTIAASFFSSIPAWYSIDPLPIVDSFEAINESRSSLLEDSLSKIASKNS